MTNPIPENSFTKGKGKKRQPPKPEESMGATDSPSREAKPKSQKTSQLNLRMTPLLKRQIRVYAGQNDLKINEVVELACSGFFANAPAPLQLVQPEPIPVKPEAPLQDKQAGRDKLVEVWASEGTTIALDRIADVLNCTASELIRDLLVEKIQELESKGVDTGLTVS